MLKRTYSCRSFTFTDESCSAVCLVHSRLTHLIVRGYLDGFPCSAVTGTLSRVSWGKHAGNAQSGPRLELPSVRVRAYYALPGDTWETVFHNGCAAWHP